MNAQASGAVRLTLLAVTAAASGAAIAAVPANIEAGLKTIGPIVDPACTAKLYRPLMPANDITSDAKPLYPGTTVVRNQSFGPDPLDVVDVFSADKGAAARTVLIFVPGGGGNKIEIQDKEGNAFYDNIGRWATKHGMVAVTMQRKQSPTWNGGAKDVASMLQWVQAHIAQYHGNPRRMFIMAHSAGNYPLGTYVGHPDLYGPGGLGVKGVIFISPAAFDILPAQPPPADPAVFGRMMGMAGKACGESGGMIAATGALPGAAAGTPGGPPKMPPGGPGGPPAGGPPGAAAGAPRPAGGPGMGGPPVDPATQLARSGLPALKQTPARIMLVNAEMDPAANGGMVPFNKALDDALCAEGKPHCPTVLIAKGHSHMSEMFAFDTPDTTVSGPILAFIRATK